uniref:Cilia- and flagella-associated protein 77-like n=1 Tax=Phallusia mammillata TaxID=59560 RepID=A0A6F9D9Y0_9ASCI|nr:cilia- and flagella-associated protein 77-like [Phallusia mammillata]
MGEYRLGIYRDSMNENPLLMKSELGMPLKRCFTLPNEGFIYGRPNVTLDGGAAEAMITREPIPIHRRREKPLQRDFVALNKGAVSSGLVSAKEHSQYRATNDVRRRVTEEDKKKILTKRIPPDMTFGISTRPSTPVFDLLEHKYQDRWLATRRESELARRARTVQQKKIDGRIYETRASLLRKYQPLVEDPPLWQMPRFSQGAAHLETFRSPEKRIKAFKHHQTDATSRTGVFGHGIYEAAKS